MSYLKCPVCGQSIKRQSRNYVCPKGHTFDIAKQGYTNLLLKQSGKIHGDNKEMLVARNHIQEKGFYKGISDKVIKILSKVKYQTILDIGCGTGYYTSNIQQQLKTDTIGVDIAKDALKIASRENKEVTYIVASNKDLPINDNSIDIVLNIFSPIYLEETNRVLKNKGHILVVSPNEHHLIEMKEIIYDSIIKKEEDRNLLSDKDLSLVLDDNYLETITLNHEDIQNLFMMTPHYWTSSVEGKNKLSTIQKLEVSLDINFKLYKYSDTQL